jgi:hypothetical protein
MVAGILAAIAAVFAAILSAITALPQTADPALRAGVTPAPGAASSSVESLDGAVDRLREAIRDFVETQTGQAFAGAGQSQTGPAPEATPAPQGCSQTTDSGPGWTRTETRCSSSSTSGGSTFSSQSMTSSSSVNVQSDDAK